MASKLLVASSVHNPCKACIVEDSGRDYLVTDVVGPVDEEQADSLGLDQQLKEAPYAQLPVVALHSSEYVHPVQATASLDALCCYPQDLFRVTSEFLKLEALFPMV